MKRTVSFHMLQGLFAAAVGFMVACGGSTSDPETASREDLNQPGGLFTVTQSKAIELRWTSGNVEEDFKGYYVFKHKRTETSSDVTEHVSYPSGTNVKHSGIPRCKKNSKFFEAFDLPASDADCEGGESEDDEDTETPGGGMAFTQDEEDEGSSDENEKLTGWVACKEEDGDKLSLAVEPGTGIRTCTVEGLENGTTYDFMVMAVMGDDLDTVSWTSNMVTDTPSVTAYSGEFKLDAKKYKPIKLDLSANNATPDDAENCLNNAGNPKNVCKLDDDNGLSADDPTIWIARDAKNSNFEQRLFLSTTTDPFGSDSSNKVQLQARGPQTWDPQKEKKAARIPEDMAAKGSSFVAAGKKLTVYNNKVFDFKITKGGDDYYGKVVISDVSYKDGAANGVATVNMTVVLQPAAGVRHYFKDARFSGTLR